jgi:hypothetical protein
MTRLRLSADGYVQAGTSNGLAKSARNVLFSPSPTILPTWIA